jgi:hypothetical protein
MKFPYAAIINICYVISTGSSKSYDHERSIGAYEAIILLSSSVAREHYPDYEGKPSEKAKMEAQAKWLKAKVEAASSGSLRDLPNSEIDSWWSDIPQTFEEEAGNERVPPAVKTNLTLVRRLIALWEDRYESGEKAIPFEEATNMPLKSWEIHLRQFKTELGITIFKKTDSDLPEWKTGYHGTVAFMEDFARSLKSRGINPAALKGFTGDIQNDRAAQLLLLSVLGDNKPLIRILQDHELCCESIAHIEKEYLTGPIMDATATGLENQLRDYDFSEGEGKQFTDKRNEILNILKGLQHCGINLTKNQICKYLVNAIFASDLDKGIPADLQVFTPHARNEFDLIPKDDRWQENFFNALNIKWELMQNRRATLKQPDKRTGKSGSKETDHQALLAMHEKQEDRFEALEKKRNSQGQSSSQGQRNSQDQNRWQKRPRFNNYESKAQSRKAWYINPKDHPKEAKEIKQKLIKASQDRYDGKITREEEAVTKRDIIEEYKPFMKNAQA